MRPTGAALIAIYHFLSALFLVLFAIFLAVGGTVLGAMFAIGALSEPACWGRRSCPRFGRMLLMAHVVIAGALAIGPVGTSRAEDHIS